MENNFNQFESAEFLFATPYAINYYLYTIDDLNNMSLIEKEQLKQILNNVKCYDFMKINYLIDRNLPLFFNIKTKKLMEFQPNTIDKNTVSKSILNDLKIKVPDKSAYEYLFGSDSTFYTKEFNLWQ